MTHAAINRAHGVGANGEKGFTLIELMVAMTLGLIVVIGVSSAYLGSKQSYRVNENLSRMQESARYAFDLLAKDIRMSGYFGCAGADITPVNTLNNPTAFAWNLGQAIYGYEATSSSAWTPVLPATTDPSYGPTSPLGGRDIVVVRGIYDSGIRVLQHPGGNPPGSADLKVSANSSLNAGDIVMVTDCLAAAIFQITNINTSGGFDNSVHNEGTLSGIIPGNATKQLGKEYTGGQILKISTRSYYIRNNTAGVPSLYRRQASADAEELVEGVEDMQILYGVDDSGDYAADRYVAANTVESDGKWGNVVSVQVTLLMRSLDNGLVNTAQTYHYNGANTTADDRRLREVFSTTITLRNRTN